MLTLQSVARRMESGDLQGSSGGCSLQLGCHTVSHCNCYSACYRKSYTVCNCQHKRRMKSQRLVIYMIRISNRITHCEFNTFTLSEIKPPTLLQNCIRVVLLLVLGSVGVASHYFPSATSGGLAETWF